MKRVPAVLRNYWRDDESVKVSKSVLNVQDKQNIMEAQWVRT